MRSVQGHGYMSKSKILKKTDNLGIVKLLLTAFIIFFSTFLVLEKSNPMSMALGRDAGAFAYIGNQIRHGDVPYLDVWDSKPPGVFFVNALGLILIKGSRWGIWFVEFLFLSLSTVFGFVAARKKFGLIISLASVLVWHYALNRTLIEGNFTEEYSLLFGFLSMFLFIRAIGKEKTFLEDAGIGICFGFSFLFRINNTGAQVSIFLVLLILHIARRDFIGLIKRYSVIGVASMIPVGLVAAYLIPKNAFGAFWEASITYNFAYSGNHFDPASSLSSGLAYIGFAGGIAMLGVFKAWQECVAKIKNIIDIEPIILWISLAVVVEVVFSGISGRNYTHYFINWMPLVAFGSALIISRFFSSLEEAEGKRLILLGGMSVFLIVFFSRQPLEFYEDIKPLILHLKVTEKEDPVAKYINVRTNKDQTVLVWGGQAGINFLAKRESPTPYLFYPLYEPSEITDRMAADFYDRLISNPPEYVVDGAGNDSHYSLIPLSTSDPESWLKTYQVYKTPYLIETLEFIRGNYKYVDTIKNVDIYKRIIIK